LRVDRADDRAVVDDADIAGRASHGIEDIDKRGLRRGGCRHAGIAGGAVLHHVAGRQHVDRVHVLHEVRDILVRRVLDDVLR